MARHNVYTVLDTKVMDRIMQDFWKSNIDTTGSLFEASTSYRILSLNSIKYRKDYEKDNRFYKIRPLSLLRSHNFQFEVWKRSMQVRYFLEATSFIILAFIF